MQITTDSSSVQKTIDQILQKQAPASEHSAQKSPLGVQAHAAQQQGFVKQKFRKTTLAEAKKYLLEAGFGKKRVDALLNDERLEKNPDVAGLFKSQPEAKLTYEKYKERLRFDLRMKQGIAFYNVHKKELQDEEAKTGTPKEMTIAILGVESGYGAGTGDFTLVNSFLTQLEDLPKRKDFALGELGNLLMIAKKYNEDPFSIKGSFAGAIGPMQFLPSSIRRLEELPKGKKLSDLLTISEAIHLTSKYLARSGATNQEGFEAKGKNFSAAREYNHSDNYAQFVCDLASGLKEEIRKIETAGKK